MKNKTLLTLLLSALLLLSFLPLSAFSGYQVTVSSGLHGKISYKGGEKSDHIVLNDQMSFNPNDFEVTVDDDRFYFKGFHVSGIEGTFSGAQDLTEDTVYVATYGIKGDLVEYYVRYVDTEGNELHPSRTLHGNEGDKPVIAYEYIDGYLPQTFNFTGTIKKGEKIEFVFVYTRVPLTPTTVIIEEGETIVTPGGVTPTPGGEGGEEPVPTPEPVPEPEPIIDIDDPDTPQTDPSNPDNPDIPSDPTPSVSPVSFILPAALGVTAGVGLLLFLLGRRKKDEDKDKE